jgi:hypothetical protein
MRIGGEAPRRRAHSKPRLKDHVQGRVAATSVRYPQLGHDGDNELQKFRCHARRQLLMPAASPSPLAPRQ